MWRIFAVSIHVNKRINGELKVRRINTDEDGPEESESLYQYKRCTGSCHVGNNRRVELELEYLNI